MDVTCDQCGTSFSVEPPDAFSAHVEAVCPACFQVLSVALPAPGLDALKNTRPPASKASEQAAAESSFIDVSALDRVRDGFTLSYEVRHPAWSKPRKIHPIEIQREIYEGKYDGREEYRIGDADWKCITEKKAFARIFKIIGKEPLAPPKRTQLQPTARFSGWTPSTSSKAAKTSSLPENQKAPLQNIALREKNPNSAQKKLFRFGLPLLLIFFALTLFLVWLLLGT